MRRARIIVPAVCTNLGPGLQSLSLALALHVTVMFRERRDTRLVIDSQGESSAEMPPDATHPVMYAAIRVFQQIEDAPLGLQLDVRNSIPLWAGLGASEALAVAGLVGANVLMDSPLAREALIDLGADITGRPDGVVAAMLGGLTVVGQAGGHVLFRRLEVGPLKAVVVVPRLDAYTPPIRPDRVTLEAAVRNLGRLALMIEALRKNDTELLGQTLQDELFEPALRKAIPGMEDAIAAARKAGAVGATLIGDGPALLVFALFNHRRVAASIEDALRKHRVESRSWTLSVDTQGVVISAAESLD